MATQRALDEAYMACAFDIAKLSHARRRQVGAIVVGEHGIIAEGVNGMPSGFENCCENVYEFHHLEKRDPEGDLRCSRCFKTWPLDSLGPNESQPYETFGDCMETKPECLHAETNAIAKIARSTNSSVGATLYCTLEPCFRCATSIIQVGFVRVVYAEAYVGPSGGGGGPHLLRKANITVELQ